MLNISGNAKAQQQQEWDQKVQRPAVALPASLQS